MDEPREKINNWALTGTILFHGVILFFLFNFGLSTPLPLPEEEGVMVVLGYTDRGTGPVQPQAAPPVPSRLQPQRAEPTDERVVTQDTEESITLPEVNRNQPRPQREVTPQARNIQQPAEEINQPQPQPQPQPEQQVDHRALFPGRDRRTTPTQGQGETGQPGAQGRPDGTTEAGAFAGGQGVGVDFSLAGRGASYLPIPEYTAAAQGRVVVAITVNRNGEVTRATAGARGSTTTDQTLWRLAEEAARRARFDIKSDAPHEQTGTITYNFIRLN